MSQGSFKPKIRFLSQKVSSVARGQMDRQTDTKVTTEGTLSGFQEFFLQPKIKDRPNIFSSFPPSSKKSPKTPFVFPISLCFSSSVIGDPWSHPPFFRCPPVIRSTRFTLKKHTWLWPIGLLYFFDTLFDRSQLVTCSDSRSLPVQKK